MGSLQRNDKGAAPATRRTADTDDGGRVVVAEGRGRGGERRVPGSGGSRRRGGGARASGGVHAGNRRCDASAGGMGRTEAPEDRVHPMAWARTSAAGRGSITGYGRAEGTKGRGHSPAWVQACMGMGVVVHGHGRGDAWAWVRACMGMGAGNRRSGASIHGYGCGQPSVGRVHPWVWARATVGRARPSVGRVQATVGRARPSMGMGAGNRRSCASIHGYGCRQPSVVRVHPWVWVQATVGRARSTAAWVRANRARLQAKTAATSTSTSGNASMCRVSPCAWRVTSAYRSPCGRRCTSTALSATFTIQYSRYPEAA